MGKKCKDVLICKDKKFRSSLFTWFFSKEPLVSSYGTSETVLFEWPVRTGLHPSVLVNVQCSVTSQRTTSGFDTIALYDANNVRLVQAGYESESPSFAPDISTMSFNWTAVVRRGEVLQVRAQSSAGISLLAGGSFPTAVGAQFTVLVFDLPLL